MDWFNEEIKIHFLNQYQGLNVGIYKSIFDGSAIMEFTLDKDCADFTLDEILDLLRIYKSSDLNTIQSKTSMIRSYAQYYISIGQSKTGINHYDEVIPAHYKSVIDWRKAASTYLTKKEIDEIISMFDNYRDKYLVLAPYEGIYGENLCEILNLKSQDVLGNNELRLCTGRKIKVSDDLYNVIYGAIDEDVAVYGVRERSIEKSDYVYRSIKMKSTENRPTDIQIKRKYFNLRNALGRDTFGIRMVYNSGFLNAIDNAVHEFGSFERAQNRILEIQNQYQIDYPMPKTRRIYEEMKEMTGR